MIEREEYAEDAAAYTAQSQAREKRYTKEISELEDLHRQATEEHDRESASLAAMREEIWGRYDKEIALTYGQEDAVNALYDQVSSLERQIANKKMALAQEIHDSQIEFFEMIMKKIQGKKP